MAFVCVFVSYPPVAVIMSLKVVSGVIETLAGFGNILNDMYRKNKDGFSPVGQEKLKVFISLSSGDKRAVTVRGLGRSLNTAFLNAKSKAEKAFAASGSKTKWIYMGFVTTEIEMDLRTFYAELQNTRKYYWRRGIAFDREYSIAFLEQEVNGAALIRYDDNQPSPMLHDKNIALRLKEEANSETPVLFSSALLDSIIAFDCKSCFYDAETGYCDLTSTMPGKNIRDLRRWDKSTLKELIDRTGTWLRNTVKSDGRFVYGYFPCFGREIETYNAIRHCLSVIALLEVYRQTGDEGYRESIRRAYGYFMTNCLVDIDERRMAVVDRDNGDEIRLGGLGLAIVMIVAYADAFGIEDDIPAAARIANLIVELQSETTGHFTHVLSYPSMEVRDEFRVIYYPGEACYGLLKLYARLKDDRYLEVVQKAFDFFIRNRYERFYDQWLAYASDALTRYLPEDRHYEFGLRNAFVQLDFIMARETTWPSFLELLNATASMIRRLVAQGKSALLADYDLDKFHEAAQIRVERQMEGIMHPELAMFYQNSDRVLYGIFSRHHFFRMRNDDAAHHLIGYCLQMTMEPVYRGGE